VETVHGDKILSDNEVEASLTSLFRQFVDNRTLSQSEQHTRNCDIVLQHAGFKIGLAPSRLEDGGVGVCVTEGLIKPRTVVALYPGNIVSKNLIFR